MVVLMLDASQDISDQDAHIAGFCLEAGRALVVAVNKWDAVDDYRRERDQAGYRPQAELPRLRPRPLHIGAAGRGHRRRAGIGRQGLRGGDGQAADAQAHARAASMPVQKQAAAAPRHCSGPSCAMRIRAAAIRRSSSSTAMRSTMCRTPIPRYLEHSFRGSLSSCRERRCASSTRRRAIRMPMRRISASPGWQAGAEIDYSSLPKSSRTEGPP